MDGENHVEGVWETTSGDVIPLNNVLWSSYLPSLRILSSERCVRLLKGSGNNDPFMLNAAVCTLQKRFICEKDRQYL